MIENSASGKVYVGQAADVRRRWIQHRHELRRNKHHNSHLQRAYNCYGEASFRWIIVQIIEATRSCETDKAEQWWADHLRHGGVELYNQGLCLSSNRGRKFSKETRSKQSRARRGRPSDKKLKLDMSYITAQYLDEKRTSTDIAKELGVSRATICKRLNELGITRSPSEYRANRIFSAEAKIRMTAHTKGRKPCHLAILRSAEARTVKFNVSEMITLYLSGTPVQVLADKYGVSRMTIQKRCKDARVIRKKGHSGSNRSVVCTASGEVFESINTSSKSWRIGRKQLTKMLDGKIENTTTLMYLDAREYMKEAA